MPFDIDRLTDRKDPDEKSNIGKTQAICGVPHRLGKYQ